MNLEVVRKNIGRYGAMAGAHDVAKKVVNRLLPLRVLRGLRLVKPRVDPAFLDLPPGFASDFLDEAQLLEDGRDPALDLQSDFVRSRLAHGDRCFGIRRNEDAKLVSYAWYSSRPTPISETLRFHFDESYVTMHKGFTRPEVRGLRLQAIGVAQALARETQRGSKGILSYVESNNFASLQSCFRMGYESIGTILVVTVNDRPMSFPTPGCRPYRLDVLPMTH